MIMDYEKLYKEALERAKEFVCIDNIEVAEYIFPELNKLGDEKIRKALIRFFSGGETLDITPTEAVAWLEKQGQQPTIEMKSAEESLGIDSNTYNKIVDECIYGDDKVKLKGKDLL